ncbi:MAG: hypothetical protein K0U79_08880 [Gammaproteobacteria bacterium]|nr:hypothetical protein [Gammaproteobacteria bacterium]
MDPAKAEQIFPIIFTLWVLFGVGFAAFFYFNRNAALKRRVLTPCLTAQGLLFLGFAVYLGTPKQFLLIAVPGVFLITLINIRAIRFCDACGRTLHNQSLFSPPKFCSKCGASLQR